MENKIEARANVNPSAFGCTTTAEATPFPEGDPFGEALAGTNPFHDQLGGNSKDLFDDLIKRFGEESKAAETNGSPAPLRNGRKAVPEIPLDADYPFIPIDEKPPPVKIKILGKEEIPGWQEGWKLVDTGTGKADGPNPLPSYSRPVSTMALNPKMIEPETSTTTLNYIKSSMNQLVLGNYTDDVTLLGTGAQIATGFLGIDLPGDIRDLTHDLTHWQWSWGHAGKTLLDGVGVLPVFGSLKYVDEAGTLVKSASKNADEVGGLIKEGAKNANETAGLANKADDVINDIGGMNRTAAKTGDLDALEHLEKAEKRGYPGVDEIKGPKKTSIAKLDLEGHAPIRHGGPNRVTDLQLEDRAVKGIDPASGTTLDAFNKYPDGSPKPHKVGRNATAFTSNEALLQADDFARSSTQFQQNVAAARKNGDLFVDPVELPLKDVFGENYKDAVRGVTRLGSKKNPTGHVSTDFTDGTIKAIYRLDQNGNINLHTLYPNPKP